MGSENGASPPDKGVLNIDDIKKLLPHRYPFLLVDRILEMEPGKSAVGLKNVTINEPFFQGHFPNKPIMPGVLVIEVMAQIGGIMMLALEEHRNKLAYLAGVENAKFRQPIYPGDTLICHCELGRTRGNIGKMKGVARVGSQLVAEVELIFALMPQS